MTTEVEDGTMKLKSDALYQLPADSQWGQARRATPLTINFTNVLDIRQHGSGKVRDRGHATDQRPMTPEGKLLTPKQIRARARRRLARGTSNRKGAVTKQEFEALYKPIEEWDLEELARGRPRGANGKFTGGPNPGWVTREVHEKAMERFQAAIKMEMGVQATSALETIQYILGDESTDNRGKALVPASTKLQAATFLLEHVVGKPKQHIQNDISVKLQAVLGAVMVNPNEALAPPSQGGAFGDEDTDTPGYTFAHLPGHTIPIGIDDVVEGEWSEDEDLDMGES